MTLREVCGLTTEEIARAFLTKPTTVAQRIVRAKAKIRDARIPYVVPSATELPDRLEAVLRVVYLVFNEGYSASSGGSLTRHDLSGEAIRLGRLLIELLPEPEAVGLLALMLLQDSRRAARTSPTGDLILLEEQDRSLWNQGQIAEGVSACGAGAVVAPDRPVYHPSGDRGRACPGAKRFRHGLGSDRRTLRHADAGRSIACGRAQSRGRGGDAGRPVSRPCPIDAILARGDLGNYHLAHAARADLCRRLGRTMEARASYEKAHGLTQQEPERRFLERRLSELQES